MSRRAAQSCSDILLRVGKHGERNLECRIRLQLTDVRQQHFDNFLVLAISALGTTLAVILARNGIAAIPAYDGQSALDIARVIPPDLLLTDVMMPDMNGIDLAMDVARMVPDCKVLLFSGQAATKDLLAVSCADGQHFAIIAKPIHPKELLVRISASLQSWRVNSRNHGFDSQFWIQSAS